MRFDDLVKYILSEAPIVDVETYSDRYPDSVQSFDSADLKNADSFVKNQAADYALIRSKKYIERLQAETAKNIPFDLKIVFVDVGNPQQERPTHGVVTLVTQPSGDPMVLSSNKKGVWMIGHKLGHALDIQYGIYNGIRDVLKTAGVDIQPGMYFLAVNLKSLLPILKDISGFKSVQSGTIENVIEYVYELVAQYVMFGRVIFRVGNTFRTQDIANKVSQEVTNVIVQAMKQSVGTVLYDTEE
jgi:hypothetical protein